MDLRSESESGAESFSESDVSMDRELWTSTAEWKQKYVVNTDTIQVQDLADSKNIIPNAWGTSKRQPVLISVRIHLSKPFDDSAEKDALTPATVHYGNLCKVLLALPDDTILLGPPKPYSLFIYATLLRKQVYSFMQLSGSLANFQGLQLEIVLPKASLLGNGIGLKDYTSYRAGRNDIQLEDGRANALMINRLHIPTLIGVNSYERGAKQMVIVDAEVDPARHMPDEAASEIEQIITKTIEEATSKTLENLILLVATRLVKYWLLRHQPAGQIRLKIEKPIAVVTAAGVGVSIVRSAAKSQPFGKRLWEECGCRLPPEVPFPLHGRLDEFLASLPASAN